MAYYPFEINMESSLEEECKKGFVSFSLVKEAHGHPIAVFLWHALGSGIKVQCVMHDLAPRQEIGSLIFSRVESNIDALDTMALPSEFSHDLKIEKLLFKNDSLTVESGIAITSNTEKELLLVSGACPYTVEVAAPTFDQKFEPEYPISEYRRERIG